jgi:T5SS/PEP-CTERM-associated repeat protein/autotransporter-associated beta strand protein
LRSAPVHSAWGPASVNRIPFGKGLLLLATTALTGMLGDGAAEAACASANFCWDASGGIWSTGSNWTPSGPPTTANTVAIDNGGTATIDSTNAQSSTASLSGNSSVVIQPGGTWTLTGTLSVGGGDGSGTLTVNGGTLNGTGQQLNIGAFGTATSSMLIENGGVVTTTNGAFFGLSGYTSSGIVTVTGTGSTWNIGTGHLDLDNPGTSTGVTVANGASLISGQAVIGELAPAGSNNNILVTGAGSTWQSSGTIVLGNVTGGGPGSATGTLAITNGGQVTTTANVAIGYNPDGGNGLKDAVTVDGSGSKLTAAQTIYAGYYGTGALTVSNGAVVSDAAGIIAYSSYAAISENSVGSVLVTGAGSLWTNSSLIVGDNAPLLGTGTSTATLTIANGGEVTSSSAIIVGFDGGATGTINIGAAAGQAAVAPGTISAPAIQFGGGGGTIVFNHTSSDYVFAIPIEGAGAVDVEAGTTVLTAKNTYTGATTINGGTLDVAGVITSTSGITVNNGGTLGGPGSITAPVAINSGGTFSPGTAGVSGSVTQIDGSLAFQSGAFYAITLNPVGATTANVSGTASLAGTVEVALAAGTSLAKSTMYDILHSGGLGGTTFGGVAPMTNLAASLSYSGTDVYLDATAAQLGRSTALNVNQQNVATALNNFFNNGGTLPPGFVSLYGLTGSSLGNALTQASGELGTSSQQTTFQAMSQFMGLLTDPFMNRTGGDNPPPGATGYADEGDSASAYAATKRTDAFAMFTKAPPAPFVQRWNVWAAGYGGSQTTDGNASVGSNSTTSSIYGTAVGADYLFSPNTVAGFALAGGGTSFSVNGAGSGRSDLFQAGAYFRHTEGPAYISAALAYGWQDITTNRTVTIGGVDQLRAEFNANAYSGRLEGGYRFVAPWTGGIGITPYAAAQFTTFDLPSYAEQAISGLSTFALGYAGQSVTDSRSELGLRGDKSFVVQDGILTLRGRLAWAHDYDPNRAVSATFQALPRFELCRQRRGTGFRLRADHGLDRDEMAQWLVRRNHLRGRVLRRHVELRRQRHGALPVVSKAA